MLGILQRLRTENRLLRQRVDLLEQECSNLADRLIQGQVTRAEVEEHTFAIKRELAAIKQHDVDTTAELETAKDRIRKLSEIGNVQLRFNSQQYTRVRLLPNFILQKKFINKIVKVCCYLSSFNFDLSLKPNALLFHHRKKCRCSRKSFVRKKK